MANVCALCAHTFAICYHFYVCALCARLPLPPPKKKKKLSYSPFNLLKILMLVPPQRISFLITSKGKKVKLKKCIMGRPAEIASIAIN